MSGSKSDNFPAFPCMQDINGLRKGMGQAIIALADLTQSFACKTRMKITVNSKAVKVRNDNNLYFL